MKKIKYGLLTTVESNMRSFVFPIVEKLDKANYEPVMICSMSEEFEKEMMPKYRCISIGIERGFHLCNLLKTIFELKKIFKNEQFDIVQYGTENVAFCASIAAWIAKVPIRIYEHWGARYVGYKGLMRIISKIIERTAALFSTDVRQVSVRNMELCVADHIYPQNKVKVLGKGGTVGVDFSQFNLHRKTEYRDSVIKQYKIPENAFIFGFIGRIQRDKGVNELIQSFKNINEAYSNIYLLLIGAMDEMNPINKKLLDWSTANKNVIFTGFVKDTYRYLSAFDIMVHPTYREGFGMVLQEAAALKIPIITTDIMGPGEYIHNGKTGILVPPRDSESLQKAMISLMNNQDQRVFFSDNNYEYTLRNFERSIMVERILKDRKELLERAGILEKRSK